MKDSYYFPHDYNARHDNKLEKLKLILGCEGIGIYWCIIEMLYENNGYLKINELELYAKMLNCAHDTIKKVIENFELFEVKNDVFFSHSQIDRMTHINAKKEKAREAIKARWNKENIRTYNERNTVKESIVKNSKEKNKEKEEDKETPQAAKFILPEFINQNTWNDYLQMRVKIKKPMTERAKQLLINNIIKIDKLKANEMLEQCILHCWQTVYPVKVDNTNQPKTWIKEDKPERKWIP